MPVSHIHSFFICRTAQAGRRATKNKEHLTCCTFAQEAGSGKLSYLTLQSDCVGSVGDVLENKWKNKI